MRIKPIEKIYPTLSPADQNPEFLRQQRRQRQQQQQKRNTQSSFAQLMQQSSDEKQAVQTIDEEPVDSPSPVQTQDPVQLYEMERFKAMLRKGGIK